VHNHDKNRQRISAEDLVTEFLEGGHWQGHYGYARCPVHDDNAASLQVTESDKYWEGWGVHCRSGCDDLEVKAEINRLLDAAGYGTASYVPPTEEERDRRRQEALQQIEENKQHALALWERCGKLSSSSLNYRMLRCLEPFDDMHEVLRDRSTGGDATNRRLHKKVKAAPIGTAGMLVALYRNLETNEPVGVQRFFLNYKQEKLDKWMLGPTSLGAIKFGPMADGQLTVSEGCESGWTAHTRGLGPAWALGSADAVESFPLPAGLKQLTICYEHDEPNKKTGVQPGAKSAAALAARAVRAGVRVLVLDPLQGDINDLIMKRERHKGDAVKELGERGLVVRVLPETEVPEQLKGARMIEVTGTTDEEQIKQPDNEREVGDIVLISADEIKPENVSWLWDKRVPLGKVTGLQGNPGGGKSQVTCYIAAKVTTGGAFIDGTAAPQGSVIFITCEDEPADTIVPRLMAAGADLSKVKILRWTIQKDKQGKKQKVTFNLTEHAQHVRSMIRQLGDVRLIIIDPVSAFMGKADTHKNSDVRAGFAELQVVIAEFDVALIAINHMSKAEGLSAINRGSGSVAFNALYRAAWLICEDPEDPSRRLMISMKVTNGKAGNGLAYRIHDAMACDRNGKPVLDERDGKPIETSKVIFEDETISISADDALKPAAKEKGLPPTVRRAKQWLEQKLGDGNVHRSKDIRAEADELGISDSALKRARAELREEGKTRTEKSEEIDGQWTIQLVPHDEQRM